MFCNCVLQINVFTYELDWFVAALFFGVTGCCVINSAAYEQGHNFSKCNLYLHYQPFINLDIPGTE